jgi:hypothetical protein
MNRAAISRDSVETGTSNKTAIFPRCLSRRHDNRFKCLSPRPVDTMLVPLFPQIQSRYNFKRKKPRNCRAKGGWLRLLVFMCLQVSAIASLVFVIRSCANLFPTSGYSALSEMGNTNFFSGIKLFTSSSRYLTTYECSVEKDTSAV